MKLPNWLKLAFAACVLIAAASLAIALVSVNIATTAKDNAAAIVRVRTDSRVAACQKDKKFALAHNALVRSTVDRNIQFLDLLATSGGRQQVRPEDQAIVDEQIAAYKSDLKNIVRVPDCTPAGIAAFYAQSGKDTTTTKAP